MHLKCFIGEGSSALSHEGPKVHLLRCIWPYRAFTLNNKKNIPGLPVTNITSILRNKNKIIYSSRTGIRRRCHCDNRRISSSSNMFSLSKVLRSHFESFRGVFFCKLSAMWNKADAMIEVKPFPFAISGMQVL